MDGTRLRWDYTQDITDRDLHDYAFENAVPTVQLPVTLPETLTGRGPTFRLPIADQVESAQSEGKLARCVLRLRFESYRAEDELEVRLNGEVLSSGSATASFGGWSRLEWMGFPTHLAEVEHRGGGLDCDLSCPPLRHGDNELEVRVLRRTVDQPDDVVLADVEVAVEYRTG